MAWNAGSVAAPGPPRTTHEALGRGLRRAAGAEHVVRLLGLDRVLVRVPARVQVADAAHLVAQHEDADGDDEPERRLPASGGARSTSRSGRSRARWDGRWAGGARRAIGRHGAWGSSDGGPGESTERDGCTGASAVRPAPIRLASAVRSSGASSRFGAVSRHAARSSDASRSGSTRSRSTVVQPNRPTYAELANVAGSRSMSSDWRSGRALIETRVAPRRRSRRSCPAPGT